MSEDICKKKILWGRKKNNKKKNLPRTKWILLRCDPQKKQQQKQIKEKKEKYGDARDDQDDEVDADEDDNNDHDDDDIKDVCNDFIAIKKKGNDANKDEIEN